MKPNLYIFGAPGKVGGAATQIRHLILLLGEVFQITVVVKSKSLVTDPDVVHFLKPKGTRVCLLKDLEPRLSGIALVICETQFFISGSAELVKQRGLRLVFSNEMMWEFKGEAEAAKKGLIDKVLFVSDFQAAKFAAIYQGIPQAITGNYVAPEDFEYRERHNATFTIGRLSRPDPMKYPEDFPVFYEELGVSDIRYRVMAWDERLKHKYHWHRFGPQWELLGPGREDAERFLHSLDLFVYPIGHLVKESWGRSTVEAMLTGAIPLVPVGHQFHNLIGHGESGFICHTFAEYSDIVQELYANFPLRQRLGLQCAQHARAAICNPEQHRQLWVEALTS